AAAVFGRELDDLHEHLVVVGDRQPTDIANLDRQVVGDTIQVHPSDRVLQFDRAGELPPTALQNLVDVTLGRVAPAIAAGPQADFHRVTVQRTARGTWWNEDVLAGFAGGTPIAGTYKSETGNRSAKGPANHLVTLGHSDGLRPVDCLRGLRRTR